MLVSQPFLFFFYFIQNIYFLKTEKTICEHFLIKLPENFPLFYQRIETKNGILECTERCIDDWQMCKSVLFVVKNVCNLFEKLYICCLRQSKKIFF